VAEYTSIIITPEFMASFADKSFSPADRRRFLQALLLLDSNERHPSLRVHQLQGDQAGVWSASASDELRFTFERLSEGRNLLLRCSRHYQR
jgi:mRNA-degrading endonuclease YafQ of YafQ-DinJ toxin-antitoxin module